MVAKKTALEQAAEIKGGLTTIIEETAGPGAFGDEDYIVGTVPTEVVPVADPDQTWGPFLVHTIVATPVGEFGVPRAAIMHLEETEVWNVKMQVMEPSWKSVFERVTIDDPSREPSGARYAGYRKAMAKRRAAGEFKAN